MNTPQGILLVDKAPFKTSFSIVYMLRKLTNVKKIGHSGTLDPLATGLMVMLIGKNFTRLSSSFANHDKEYEATIFLGKISSTYDEEGLISDYSNNVPSIADVEKCLESFNGLIKQMPPMFSAKKINGKKLYELARKGITIERKEIPVNVTTTLVSYKYPYLDIKVACSKGTYIRTLAHDIGQKLHSGAYLKTLKRTRCGSFQLQEAVPQDKILNADFQIFNWLRNV
jgi:tRNA pseudouridine55 synthase